MIEFFVTFTLFWLAVITVVQLWQLLEKYHG